MKLTTRLRLLTVRKLTELLRIPVTIHEDALPEMIHDRIDLYIGEADLLLDKVWEATREQKVGFVKWANDDLFENMGNPFLLHDHPLYYAGRYLGVIDANDPRAIAAEAKFTNFAQTEPYSKMFRDGFRVNFGLTRK